ncbi:cobalt-precorrin-6A reductase [Parasulfitobacter algicola]|uniref:Cobalt-precorrin-6A reductase n=1 Tax=Parasulfitobacter algicola TaxID=2614809 RepID=A0ABX2IRA6_9RHOB|nr:cobalt-precorrin-6A reductase [Sulfitobacter algicola]NSX55424.1 cobalt-precorrin-6A reductase [Sulfitobacter algicola]
MRVLLLAGSGEARTLAHSLMAMGIDTIASFASDNRVPDDLGIRLRIGGFGGAEPFAEFLQTQGIAAVLDATHPFAHLISLRTSQVCAQMGIPYLQLLRPEWKPAPDDSWTVIDDETQAADHIPVDATVFLATGRQTLDRFANMSGRRLICRRIDQPKGPFPFKGGEYLVGIPPFSQAEEEELFTSLGIDWLVVKNAGGMASRSKLDAARALGLPVAMIRRPAKLDAPQVESVDQALNWVKTLGIREK